MSLGSVKSRQVRVVRSGRICRVGDMFRDSVIAPGPARAALRATVLRVERGAFDDCPDIAVEVE